ncbi:DMT family transporter [Pseudonocardia sp. TRM90224]|uniref:DMT family transporter n=1 Tax=Pseudonocardia sp. TRM90224 TaxID=2812678 RepID=UPI001E5F3007|nr:DMT family transporter [Pseudonocardia sp. TRM90224]
MSSDLSQSEGAPPRPSRAAMVVPPVFVVLWSSAFIAGVIGVGAAPPLLLTFSRFAAAGILLALIALTTRAPWPRGVKLAHIAVSGLLIQAVQFGAFYSALSTGLPAAVVALWQGLNPVVIALLAATFLHERIGPRQWLGFVLGAVGVILAVVDRVSFSVAGMILCIIGLLGLSVGTVYQKRFAADLDVRSGTAVQFIVSAPVIGVLTLVLETPHITDWGSFALALGWIVLVNSVGTFVLLNLMLRKSSASKVGTLFFLTPAVTAILTWLTLGQTLQPLTIIGLAISGVGVLLATMK